MGDCNNNKGKLNQIEDRNANNCCESFQFLCLVLYNAATNQSKLSSWGDMLGSNQIILGILGNHDMKHAHEAKDMT